MGFGELRDCVQEKGMRKLCMGIKGLYIGYKEMGFSEMGDIFLGKGKGIIGNQEADNRE